MQHNQRLSTLCGVASPLRQFLRITYCVIEVAILFAPIGAAAQAAAGQEAGSLAAQKEALFQQMLRNPANLDVTFAYAEVSARLGDYEAAVSALERMLLFNPDLPRVQVELGALYFRMGSYDIARDYFAKAAAANPPPEVRARIDQYLAEIEKSQSRHHVSGYFFTGIQYQTDANVAGSSLILSPIGPVLLGNQFTKQASGSVFASGSAVYSYDLETQNRDTLDVTGAGYLTTSLCSKSPPARVSTSPTAGWSATSRHRSGPMVFSTRWVWVGISTLLPAVLGSNMTRSYGTTWP